jgi:RimJ/RimL family protein N-acetyltransferase
MLACQTPSVRCVNKTRLTLEMSSHDQLVRAQPDPRVHLRAVDQDDSVMMRIFHEVGDPHLWSAESWAGYGSAPTMRHWLIYVDGEPAGLLTLRVPDGEIEIVSFGLVPDRQGHGFGGPALTLAVDLAWTAFGGEVSRVWLAYEQLRPLQRSAQLPETRVHDRRGGRSSGERSRQLGAVEFSITVGHMPPEYPVASGTTAEQSQYGE